MWAFLAGRVDDVRRGTGPFPARNNLSFIPARDRVLAVKRPMELDTDFLRRLRQGEAEAFGGLVRAFAPRVRRMAIHYFRSPFDQEEAVQEVFLLLHRQREAIDPLRAAELSAFVSTLARRRMFDLLRTKQKEAPSEELSDEAWADDSEEPLRRVQDAELVELLKRFEEKLKPAYRSYFRAVFVEGKEFDEARAALALSRLRSRYLKMVLLTALRRHPPLLDYLGKRRAP